MQMEPTIFYVSTQGNDSWSGRLAEPSAGGGDGPFATLHRARNALRELKAQAGEKGLGQSVQVQIRGGTYYMREALMLRAQDSGTAEFPIAWCAYGGEEPVLSGGQVVTGWTQHQGNILKAVIPQARGGHYKTRQLFFKGKRMSRACWPKPDPKDPHNTGWAFTDGPESPVGWPSERVEAPKPRDWYGGEGFEWGMKVDPNQSRAFRYRPQDFPRRWAKPAEAEVSVFPGPSWYRIIVPVERVDEERRVIVLRDPIPSYERLPWSCINIYLRNNRFRMENVLEELTEPGEWCLDGEDGTLYFWPPEEMGDGDVVIPVLDKLLELREANYVAIRGLTFTQTTDGENSHREGLIGYGAIFPVVGWRYCGEAVRLWSASHCAIEENVFDQVGGNAIYVEQACYRNEIRRNVIRYGGAHGVAIMGNKVRHPLYTRVEDNEIHHTGVYINYTAGVFMGLSDGTSVAHNYIHDVPHHAVCLSTNGLGRNLVEFNEIRRAALEMHDTGAINCWMDVPGEGWPMLPDQARSGHIIRYNLIAEVPGANVGPDGKIHRTWNTMGIYLDDGSSNCTLSHNIVVGAGVGFMFHTGQHNQAENNLIIDCIVGVWDCNAAAGRPGNELMANYRRGERISRNIFVFSEAKPTLYLIHGYDPMIWQEADYNVIHTQPGVAAPAVRFGTPDTDDPTPMPLDRWRKEGFDQNSIHADPLLMDKEGQDYRLRPDSPAFKLGFVQIPVERIGIRKK